MLWSVVELWIPNGSDVLFPTTCFVLPWVIRLLVGLRWDLASSMMQVVQLSQHLYGMLTDINRMLIVKVVEIVERGS